MDPVTALVLGTGLKVAGAYSAGEAADAEGKSLRRQYGRAADETVASGQRRAAEIRRQGDVLKSDAIAAMAGGGGVADDVGAIKRLADIEQVTNYNALSALYGANTEAQQLRYSGEVAKARGTQARKTSYLNMGATVLDAFSQRRGKK